MKFGKKTFFSFLSGLTVLSFLLELAHVNFLYTTTFLSFCTSILLPGFLLSLILQIRKLSLWEHLSFTVGLGIAFLEFGGLFLNILLPLFGIKDPLAFQNLVYGFNGYIVLLLLFAWVRTKQLTIQIHFPRRSTTEKLLYALPLCFPILATLGAIVLNNNGSNILTLTLLVAIVAYVLLLVQLHAKVAADLYPYALFFIGIASLFTTSLRSWYITGHDITLEFYVFQLANQHHIWSMAFNSDAYNSCLSITILPTVLANILSIQDMYVYKVVFQVLFAISPVLLFFIARRYTTPILAFLAAFFFMSFPTFFNDMPMLNRQEIGFIFFGLVLYVMLRCDQAREFYTKVDDSYPSEFSSFMRKTLFIIFGSSVLVSHYSTNFVLLALVASTYGLTQIVVRTNIRKIFSSLLSRSRVRFRSTFTTDTFLSLPLVVILFLMTYFWNTVYTGSSRHADSVVSKFVNSMLLESSAAKSSDLSYSIFFSPQLDPNQQLQDYIQSTTHSAEEIHSRDVNIGQFYSKSITGKYPSYLLSQKRLAPTPFGSWLSSLHVPVFDIQARLRSLSASLIQVFVFIGLLAILLFEKKKPFDLQYLLLCFSSIVLLVLETLLPSISVEYGILRMFQQLLFLLSLPVVFGLYSLFFFIKEQKRVLFIGIIAVTFFLILTGFISHLTGEYYPQMTLDNAGLYYDAYYVHTSDVLAIDWISKNNVKSEPVEASSADTNKLLAYGQINALDEILPSIIRKNAYVYEKNSTYTVVLTSKEGLIFNSSKPFLDENKDLLYSNGNNDVYK